MLEMDINVINVEDIEIIMKMKKMILFNFMVIENVADIFYCL